MAKEMNEKRIFESIKKKKDGIYAFDVDNMLYGRTPRMVFTLVQPNEKGQYVSARFFADEEDLLTLINHTYRSREGLIFQSFRGSKNKKRDNKVESRTISIRRNEVNGNVYYNISIDNCEGEQVMIENKQGEKVEGVVKPKRGGEVYAKNRIGLSADEMFCMVDSIKMELQAWRTAVNIDMFYHPDRYAWHSNEEIPQGVPPTAE